MSPKQFTLIYLLMLVVALVIGLPNIEAFAVDAVPALGGEMADGFTYAKLVVWVALGGGAFTATGMWCLQLLGYDVTLD